jgi:hypothetical protein
MSDGEWKACPRVKKPCSFCRTERPKAEALGYLEAKSKAETRAQAIAKAKVGDREVVNGVGLTL